MNELVETRVREVKGGSTAIWLEGGKLLRNQWLKGDSAKIEKVSDSEIKLVRLSNRAPRSTCNTQNISGRTNRSRSNEAKPILDMVLSKVGVNWDLGTPLVITITKELIQIKVNDYLAARKERITKIRKAGQLKKASKLLINHINTPIEPHHPASPSTDLAEIHFHPHLEANAFFFNALNSIENANPFAILVNGYKEQHNAIGDGFGSVLKSFGYNLIALKTGSVLAYDNSLILSDDVMNSPTLHSLETAFDLTTEQLDASYSKSMIDRDKRYHNLKQVLRSQLVTNISLFHGGGSLDYGMKHALSSFGLKPKVKLVSELNDQYFSHSVDVNGESFSNNTTALHGDMQSFDPFQYATGGMLATFGVSCVGASRAGISKLGLKNAEMHPKAGSLFYPTMKFVAANNISIAVLENTDTYMNTDSYLGFKVFFEAMGYVFSDGIISSYDCGSIEKRKRLFSIASDSALDLNFDSLFDNSSSFIGPRKCINFILDESIPDDSDQYREYLG